MKPKNFLRIFLNTCILVAFTSSLHAQMDERQKLTALEKRRMEAMVHRDTTTLSGLLSDSLTYIHSSGVIDNKKSFIKDIGSGRITYIFIYPEKISVVVDGNIGWIYGRANLRFKLASMTHTIDLYVSFVEVYQLKRSQWQLVLCQNAHVEKGTPYYNIETPQVQGGHVPSIY
jgi:hypothetical protein